MSERAFSPEEAPLTIGGLSRATGIAVETLRTWERRYDFPQPVRTPSGHRRYTLDTVERLKLVQQALSRGHRVSAVLSCPPEQLEALLRVDGQGPENVGRAPQRAPARAPAPERTALPHEPTARVERWVELVKGFEGEALDRDLEQAWQSFGARVFVLELSVGFLRSIGERWIEGDVSIAHEHFASERLRDFLSRQWRPLSNQSGGPRVVCAALTGEHHTLPLHLAAVLLALEGIRPVLLGADTPELEVARAALSFDARAVMIGVSKAADSRQLYDQLVTLRGELPDTTPIMVGGSMGALPSGTERLGRFDDITDWARSLHS